MSDVDTVEDFLSKNFQKTYGIKLIREYTKVMDFCYAKGTRIMLETYFQMGEEPLQCFNWINDSYLACRRRQIKQINKKKTRTSIEKRAKFIKRQFTERCTQKANSS